MVEKSEIVKNKVKVTKRRNQELILELIPPKKA